MAPGRLITIEGLDGAGKTTLAAALADALRSHGVDVLLMREPGGVEASERVRSLVKDPLLTLGPRAEALLYAAARAQLVDEAIRPALESGAWVLLDRFVDSSLAYQGAARGLGIDEVRAVNAFGTGGLTADRTLLLSIGAAAGLSRARGRGEADRLEREPEAFFGRIADAYAALAESEPDRIRVIDAQQPPSRVLAAALDALSDLLVPGQAA